MLRRFTKHCERCVESGSIGDTSSIQVMCCTCRQMHLTVCRHGKMQWRRSFVHHQQANLYSSCSHCQKQLYASMILCLLCYFDGIFSFIVCLHCELRPVQDEAVSCPSCILVKQRKQYKSHDLAVVTCRISSCTIKLSHTLQWP